MSDENLLAGFAEGFAKMAESAGFHGEQIRSLMELSVDLAQREVHRDAFYAGFNSYVRGE